jgi:hypothetical protein
VEGGRDVGCGQRASAVTWSGAGAGVCAWQRRQVCQSTEWSRGSRCACEGGTLQVAVCVRAGRVRACARARCCVRGGGESVPEGHVAPWNWPCARATEVKLRSNCWRSSC